MALDQQAAGAGMHTMEGNVTAASARSPALVAYHDVMVAFDQRALDYLPRQVKLGPCTAAWRAADIRSLTERLSGADDAK